MFRKFALALLVIGYGITSVHADTSVTPQAAEASPPKAAVQAPRPAVSAKPKTESTKRASLIRPRPSPLDPRLVVFPYTPEYIYQIPTKLNDYTHIELAEGERITAFVLPDKLLWSSKVAPTKRDIFVKPIVPNNQAAGTIITNLRRYAIELSVGGEDDTGLWYQRVSWDVDEEEFQDTGIGGGLPRTEAFLPKGGGLPSLASGGGVSSAASPRHTEATSICGQTQVQVDKLNFNYEIIGDAPFRPLQVFDDGHFTWVKFPPVQDMPPLFAINPTSGDGELETFIPCRGYYLVQALLPGGALLKLGKPEVRIVNKNTQTCGKLLGLFGDDCNKAVGNIRDR